MSDENKGINFEGLLSKIPKFEIPNINKSLLENPAYNFNPYAEKEVESHKIIKDLSNDEDKKDFNGRICDRCGSKIDNTYHWFYLESKYSDKDLIMCCYDCLKKLYDDKGSLDMYEINEYSRCTAYYKCKELGNLRNKCETGENLSYTSIMSLAYK